MLLTALCAAVISVWLWWHGRFQAGLKPLAAFCGLLSSWCLGHLALQHDMLALGKALILANPLIPMCFLIFALRYVEPANTPLIWALRQSQRWWIMSTLLIVLLSWSAPSAYTTAVQALPVYFVFDGFGFVNLGYTVVIGALAHAVLWHGRHVHQGNKRHSMVAISMTAALGFVLATSFVFPSFGLHWFPYPMLGLPLYLLLLVYSVVRYQLLAVNAVARRAVGYLVMALLLLVLMGLVTTLFGQFGMPLLATIPNWQLWLYTTLVLSLALACSRPVARLAEQLIYPGVQLSPAMVATWQQQLSRCHSWQALADVAAELIQTPIRQPLQIQVWQHKQCLAKSQYPAEICLQLNERSGLGWQSQLIDHQTLTPTVRFTLDMFSAMLTAQCALLQQHLQHAESERQRLADQHLVELGALAAAMAHELRNPLNVIAMASAAVEPELKSIILTQLQRSDRLIADMLVYAGKLDIQPSWLPLRQSIDALWQALPSAKVQFTLEIAPELMLWADPYRVQQVMQNLLDNALAFLQQQAMPKLWIHAERQEQQLVIWLANNGPAIDPSIQMQLFQPFISKRSGGSGLGLAIVKRIMDAHQAEIALIPMADWPVCFELRFPWKDHLDV